ncbi:MAG: hypothetical protein AB7G04_06545 [Hyphomonadaceae bacterium]
MHYGQQKRLARIMPAVVEPRLEKAIADVLADHGFALRGHRLEVVCDGATPVAP